MQRALTILPIEKMQDFLFPKPRLSKFTSFTEEGLFRVRLFPCDTQVWQQHGVGFWVMMAP